MVYTRIIIPIWAIYMGCMSSLRHFARRKKMKKILNTPLRISAGCDIICGVETTIGRMIRSLIGPSRKEKRLDALLRDDARRNDATACDIGSRGREWQSMGRVLQVAHMGNESC